MPILDSKGNPYTPTPPAGSLGAGSTFKKASAPALGEVGAQWAGSYATQFLNFPGGGVVQFDLNRLTHSDYRQMMTHYQVKSSLSVLTFMLHQLDWRIECDNPRITAVVEENMRDIWTRLSRALSQAFWAGYSPCILQWENDPLTGRTKLAKIKDLAPETAFINWKKIDGTLPRTAPPGSKAPSTYVYDGIRQLGYPWPIPTENTLWYPLLMDNGDMTGQKLLKSAFQPWYFSTLIHLFSNRYFERFGEPVPVGRAPFGDTVNVGGTEMDSNVFMARLLQDLRSRSVVVLPSDLAQDSSSNRSDKYEYNVEYMESQMRGADFERYLTRLDEEISLALFTPLLLVRTADVGSYNLGVSHLQMYLWQLNAIAADWAEYINKYILSPMVDYNFGVKAKRARIKFYKMGRTKEETVRNVLSSLVAGGKVKPDLQELGQAAGLTLEEIEQVTEDPAGTVNPDWDSRGGRQRDDGDATVADKIELRVAPQAVNAYRKGNFGNWSPDHGYASEIRPDKLEAFRTWSAEFGSLLGEFSSPEAWTAAYAAGMRVMLNE